MRSEAGGLSGKPLFERVDGSAGQDAQAGRPGAGDHRRRRGVIRPETALEKIRAGADLVQLYTCMIYAGPSLAGHDRQVFISP